MMGYLDNKKATDDCIKDGWFHTGRFYTNDAYNSLSPTVTPRKSLFHLRKSRIPLEEIAFLRQKLEMEVRCHKISH